MGIFKGMMGLRTKKKDKKLQDIKNDMRSYEELYGEDIKGNPIKRK